jgi:hypothetical protein
LILPVHEDISDLERMIRTYVQAGGTFEVWGQVVSYEGAYILSNMLEAEAASADSLPRLDPSPTNPD